jgi:ferredoxin/flavodoxin---NADP+ reductase
MPTRHGSGAGAIRVAIVGAGPSGLYAADGLLTATQLPVEIDMIDRLPTPFGLVRYGVAPDHPAIKSVVRTFEEILAQPRLRFLGGVEVGADVSAEDLRLCYDAVIYATGAPLDRKLGIPVRGRRAAARPRASCLGTTAIPTPTETSVSTPARSR